MIWRDEPDADDARRSLLDAGNRRKALHAAALAAQDVAMLRAAEEWHTTLHAPVIRGYTPTPGMPLYEPSSPAPKQHRWLAVALCLLGILLTFIVGWRRLHPETRVMLFALAVAAAALVVAR